MSDYLLTMTATPRPRSEWAFTLFGAGTRMPVDQARWAFQPGSHDSRDQAMRNVGQPAELSGIRIFDRVRVVKNAAKPGSPPRGNPG